MHGAAFRICKTHAFELRREDKQFADLHSLVEAAFFGKVSDAQQMLTTEALAEKSNLTAVRHRDADHHSNGTRFSRAVRTEYSKDASLRDRHRNTIDRLELV